MFKIILLFFLLMPTLQAQTLNVNRSLEATLQNQDITALTQPAFMQQRLQTNYALQVAQYVISYLTVYELKNDTPLDQLHLQQWSQTFLATDPFIQFIDYVPQEILRIHFQNNLFVTPQLNGLALVYQYQMGVWRLSHYEQTRAEFDMHHEAANSTTLTTAPSDAPESDAKTNTVGLGISAPYHLDVLYAYGIITHHCQTPLHYQTEADKLYDTEWCPVWLDLIMSP